MNVQAGACCREPDEGADAFAGAPGNAAAALAAACCARLLAECTSDEERAMVMLFEKVGFTETMTPRLTAKYRNPDAAAVLLSLPDLQ